VSTPGRDHPTLFGEASESEQERRIRVRDEFAARAHRADVNPVAPAGVDLPEDRPRLATQQAKVARLMQDGEWRTLAEIVVGIEGGSETGISARLRDLRKPKNGGHIIDRRPCGVGGLHEYRLVPKT